MDFFESGIHGYSTHLVSAEDREYLTKYWLDARDLGSTWSRVLSSAFVIRGDDVSVAGNQSADVRMGGVLFLEEDFDAFRKTLSVTSSERFAVVEDVGQQQWQSLSSLAFLRFSFPGDISWDELAKSCQVADDVFGRPIRAFFVVSDNGRVGKYVNNDADPPYEVHFFS